MRSGELKRILNVGLRKAGWVKTPISDVAVILDKNTLPLSRILTLNNKSINLDRSHNKHLINNYLFCQQHTLRVHKDSWTDEFL